MVYGGVVVMSIEIVFRGDVIRNASTLAMTRDDEVLLPVLLDNLVGLFLSRSRSRRVGGTTRYLPVYEPILNKVLRFPDRIISRTPIRDDGLARRRVMKHEVVFWKARRPFQNLSDHRCNRIGFFASCRGHSRR